MTFGSCHFLFQPFTQRDKPDQITADMDDVPAAHAAAFVRRSGTDRLDQLLSGIRRRFGRLRTLPGLLKEGAGTAIIAWRKFRYKNA